MKIAFIDFTRKDFTVETVYHNPLGGTQSVLCYLSETLAQQGHEIFLITHTSAPGMYRGVMCLSAQNIQRDLLRSLDALVISNSPESGKNIKPLLGDKTLLILENGHAHDQPRVQCLSNPDIRSVYDAIVLKSNWQKTYFHKKFDLEPAQVFIIGNAASPGFDNLFPEQTAILSQKSKPPVLAYISTPFRGLDILINIFPKIREMFPDITLNVFSSMKVYHISQSEDKKRYGWLYRKCQETQGIKYRGPVAQPQLAEELKSTSLLTYPNTFAETSCIAMMEAMASGCWIISSQLGALPETGAGFAELIPDVENRDVYKAQFIKSTIEALNQFTSAQNDALENHLRQQVNYANQCYNWVTIAQQWIQLLEHLR